VPGLVQAVVIGRRRLYLLAGSPLGSRLLLGAIGGLLLDAFHLQWMYIPAGGLLCMGIPNNMAPLDLAGWILLQDSP